MLGRGWDFLDVNGERDLRIPSFFPHRGRLDFLNGARLTTTSTIKYTVLILTYVLCAQIMSQASSKTVTAATLSDGDTRRTESVRSATNAETVSFAPKGARRQGETWQWQDKRQTGVEAAGGGGKDKQRLGKDRVRREERHRASDGRETEGVSGQVAGKKKHVRLRRGYRCSTKV